MSQRNVNVLADLLDLSLEDLLREAADPSDVADISAGRTVMAEQVIRHRFDYTNEPSNSLYRYSYENAPTISAPHKPIYDAQGDFVGYEMQHIIVQGDERAAGTPHCDPLELTTCETDLNEVARVGEKGKVTSTIGNIPLLIDNLHLKKCLTDTMNVKDGQVFNEVVNELFAGKGTLTMEKAGNLAELFTRNVKDYIMREVFLMDRRLSLTDNGLIATVRAGHAALDGTHVFVDRVDMFANKGEDFAIFRPNPAQEIGTNCAVACAKQWQLMGYAQLGGVPDWNRLSAPMVRSFDLNGTLMDDFALQAGDAIVALGGATQTINGGNFTNNLVILPYWGVAANQQTQFLALTNCCRGWGITGEKKLAQQRAGVGLFTGLDDIMGVPVNEFEPYLIPRVIDCCTDPEARSLTHLNIFDYVDHSKAVLDQAKQNGYLPEVTSGAKIVIQAARRTLEEIARSVLANYPNYASKEFNVDASNPRISVRKAVEIMNLEFEGMGYTVEMQDSTYGMAEGEVRIGLEKGTVTAVTTDLQGYMGEYNQGNFVNKIPSVFRGQAMTPGERMERKQMPNIYFVSQGHAQVDSMFLEVDLERAYNKFQLLAGATTIIQNVHFRLPDNCPPVCATKNCEGC